MAFTPGPLAFIGGAEWTEGCTFDTDLLAASGGSHVLVLPTAAAYEHPERLVAQAGEWFAAMGADVEGLMVVTRSEASDLAAADIMRRARFVYLAGESPLHLRSVLKSSPLWDALVETWRSGAVVAASSGAAMALVDPMVDIRGGALTLGLGLVTGMTIVPHLGEADDDASGDKLHRTFALAPPDVPVVAIPNRTALIRDPDGSWRTSGAGVVDVHLGGVPAPDGLGALPADLPD